MVHMMSNLITSQLLAPYTAEFGLIIRYLEMLFGIMILIYTMISPKFKAEMKKQMEEYKSMICDI